jgi:iron complex transport system ATP-binding protein
MILDEITAFLDLPRRVEIMRLLATLAHESGLAILVSTHDLELALRTADRLLLFDAGGRVQAGAPEDLVLDGAFERAFAADGLAFDRAHGTFTTRAPANGAIGVLGDGIAAVWTAHAVARAGYSVAADPRQAATRIEVRESGGSPAWLLVGRGAAEPIQSLEALVARLKSDRMQEV